MSLSMDRILDEVQKIPPLPEIASRVLQMTNDPDVSAAELNRVISRDEALTANLLKVCNSAYYGLPRVISSVTQAIMYLGFQTVRNMVLTTTMDSIYARQDLSAYSFTKNGLSEHSLGCAIGSQILSRKLRPGLADSAYTAGLLHDVGKIVLGKFVKENRGQLIELSKGNFITLEAEHEVLGVDHAEVGSRIADRWNFPQELILAIGFHHHPDSTDGRPLLAVIAYLANIVVLRIGCGLQDGPHVEEISPYCAEATGYSETEMSELCEEVSKAIKTFSQSAQKA